MNILADPTLPVLIVVLVLLVYFRWKSIEKRPYFAVTTDRVLSYGYVKIVELATKKNDFEFSVKNESAKVKLKERSLKFTVLKDKQTVAQSS